MNEPSAAPSTSLPGRLWRIVLGTFLPSFLGSGLFILWGIIVTGEGDLKGWLIVPLFALAMTAMPAFAASLLMEFVINRPAVPDAVVYTSGAVLGIATGLLFTGEQDDKHLIMITIGTLVGLVVAHILRRHRLKRRLL